MFLLMELEGFVVPDLYDFSSSKVGNWTVVQTKKNILCSTEERKS